MSGSEQDRWGPGPYQHGTDDPGQAELAGKSSVREEHVSDENIGRLTDAMGQLQSRLDRMADELSTVQAHVNQAGINAEEAITAALEDILARLDRGVETTAGDAQERALAQVQEAVGELLARSERQGNDGPGGEDVGPLLARVESKVNGLAAKVELEQDTLEAVTRIESAVTGLADEGRYERRSLVVRLDQLLETVKENAGSDQPDTGAAHQDELIEKLDRITEQVESLRRRVAFRTTPEPISLDDSTIAAVADAVTNALAVALTNRVPQALAPAQRGPANDNPTPDDPAPDDPAPGGSDTDEGRPRDPSADH